MTGDRPPILFIHGMWGQGRYFDPLRLRFDARGHSTNAPNLPLHDGPPGGPPPLGLGATGISDYVEFLVAEAQRAPAPPVIVGHSMGGVLAQLVAARVQPRGLVLLSTGPTAAVSGVALDPMRTLAGVTTNWGWWRQPTLIDRQRAMWGIYNEVPPEIAEQEYQSLVPDSGRVLFQMAFPWADPARGTRVDTTRLAMPTLIVVGDRDRITPVGISRGTARKLPGRIDYRELPGVGHWLFHEPVVSRVAAEIEAFIDRL